MSRIHISEDIQWTDAHPRSYLLKFYPDEVPGEESNILKCTLDFGQGAITTAYAYGNHIFIDSGRGEFHRKWNSNDWTFRDLNIQLVDVDPPFVSFEVIGNAFEKKVTVKKRRRSSYSFNFEEYEEEVVDSYTIGYHHFDSSGYTTREAILEPLKWLKIRFFTDTDQEIIDIPFKRPEFGHVDVSASTCVSLSVSTDFHGMPLQWSHDINNWLQFRQALNNYTFSDTMAAWGLFLDGAVDLQKIDTKSIKSVENKKDIKPNIEKLQSEEPVLYKFFMWLHDGAVRDGMSNNQLLAPWLKEVGTDYLKIKDSLTRVIKKSHDSKEEEDFEVSYRAPDTRRMCLMFDEAKEKSREKRENKEWYLRKTNGEKADGLGCDKDTYPLTHAAISEGNIPFNVFHDPSDKLRAVNTEWDLWEKSLARDGWADTLYKIAQDASRRTTYDKDITPYLSFLFKIEKYLDRHAPRPKPNKKSRKKVLWQAVPKYVESQWELEMDDPGDQTVKRRSALTPVPDNDAGTIEVPYAAIAISGRQTTYCYSQYYCLFEEGYLDYETDTPVVNELEEKLNGRDDYGLMYYTLTGSPTNRGYPTFLTIFERRKDFTHVHFHRVHPNKYKDGRPVPACNLIQECYRYMAGNVRAEEIHAQQGDLVFIRCEEPKGWSEDEMKGVDEFESHSFIVPEGKPAVGLIENKNKSIKNRLGHMLARDDFVVKHPEHEDLTNMPSGWYDVRRCRSWEANPTAIWSFTID